MPKDGQNGQQPGQGQQPPRPLMDEPIIQEMQRTTGIRTDHHPQVGHPQSRRPQVGHPHTGHQEQSGYPQPDSCQPRQPDALWSSFDAWGTDSTTAERPAADEALPAAPAGEQVGHPTSLSFLAQTETTSRDPSDPEWSEEVSRRLDAEDEAEAAARAGFDQTATRDVQPTHSGFHSGEGGTLTGADDYADANDGDDGYADDRYTSYTAFDDNDYIETDDDDGYGDPAEGETNWALVNVMKDATAEELRRQLESARNESRFTGRRFTKDDRRQLTRSVCVGAVYAQKRSDDRSGDREWTQDMVEGHVQALLDSFIGYGRLQPLFDIQTAENITISGPSVVVEHTDGRIELLPPVSDSDADLEAQVAYICEHASPPRKLNPTNPSATVMLGKRYRMAVINRQVSVRPTVAIRRHNLMRVSLAGLVARQVMPLEVAQFLDAAVRAKMSIIVSGPQGAGKTTLLRALLDAVPIHERIATVETDLELFAHLAPERRNDIALFERVAMGESKTATDSAVNDIKVNELIPATLRQKTGRVVVGELLGSEGAAMMQAMASGAGSLSSIHSDNISGTISRLANRVSASGEYPYAAALTAIGQHINLIVHVEEIREDNLRLKLITGIREVKPAAENGSPTVGEVYTVRPETGYRGGDFHLSGEIQAKLRRHRRPLPQAKRKADQ